MKGSDKQVKWALKIKAEYIEKFNEAVESLKDEGVELSPEIFKTFEIYLKINDSGFWLLDNIRNRRPNKLWLLDGFEESLECGGILIRKYKGCV